MSIIRKEINKVIITGTTRRLRQLLMLPVFFLGLRSIRQQSLMSQILSLSMLSPDSAQTRTECAALQFLNARNSMGPSSSIGIGGCRTSLLKKGFQALGHPLFFLPFLLPSRNTCQATSFWGVISLC